LGVVRALPAPKPNARGLLGTPISYIIQLVTESTKPEFEACLPVDYGNS
jgi:hypothetical protein